MKLLKQKYYSATIRLTDRKERAVIVKANNVWDAEKLATSWRGKLMSITEVLTDNGDNDLLSFVTKKEVTK